MNLLRVCTENVLSWKGSILVNTPNPSFNGNKTVLNSDYPILRYHSGGKKKGRTLGTIKTVCLTSKKRKRMNTEEMITEVEMDL